MKILMSSPCDKVEDKTKSDANRKGGQCASEECQKDEGEAEPDEDCYEAGKGRVPVPVAARLAHLWLGESVHFPN